MNVHISATKRSTLKRSDTNSVSFDVFDTFIMRACTTPDGVIERAFQLSPAFKMFPDVSASYVEHRRQAEARARKDALHRTKSAEVTIDEIYRYFPLHLFKLQKDDLPRLIEAEFAAEIELCRVNPDMLSQYRELRSAGARTGFISDTYWSVQQLGALLRACCPDLQWDFLYASCHSGTSKSEGLFKVYLDGQSIDARNATHIGDNPKADIDGARRYGVTGLYVPQTSAAFASVLNRETTAAKLLCQSKSTQLDHGMRTLRRLVTARVPKQTPSFDLGVAVVGPVMQVFDAFVADRCRQIEGNASRMSVAFLGRDGYLSHKIWKQSRDEPARYLEINRRVSMVASAATLTPLIDLVSELPAIDAAALADMLKYRSPRVDAFFARCPNGRCSGADLAKALPDLLSQSEVAAIAADVRRELMHYLRTQIPDLNTCSDVVLADLGYSGSIQKALRRVFDIEGVKAHIHGLYLLTLDDGFIGAGAEDTFEGLISDITVTPHVKRLLLRNIAVLEQICCAPTGSVRGYRDGVVSHEVNGLTPEQHAMASEAQAGVLAFVAAAHEQALRLNMAPLSDLAAAAATAAATLGRLLLMPTDDELVLLSQLQHDVNLGTQAFAPLLDADYVAACAVTRALPEACTVAGPPMWLAGTFAALSPSQGYLYTLFGAGLLPGDIFGDAKCGRIDVTLTDRRGVANVVQVNCYRTGTGEIRIRVPMSPGMGIRSVSVPVARLAMQGVISGPYLQSGHDVEKALRSSEIVKLDGPAMLVSGMAWNDGHYSAAQDDAMLIVSLPMQTDPVAMLSIGLMPLGAPRVLAID